jgi:hypothetical protein
LTNRIVIRNGSSRDPPTPGRLRTTDGVCPASGLVLIRWTSATATSDIGRARTVLSLSRLVRTRHTHVRAGDSHRGRRIGEARGPATWISISTLRESVVSCDRRGSWLPREGRAGRSVSAKHARPHCGRVLTLTAGHVIIRVVGGGKIHFICAV